MLDASAYSASQRAIKASFYSLSSETRMNVANGVGLSSAAAVGFGTAALLSSGGISLGDVIVSTATAIFSAAILLPATYDAMGVAELAAEASRVVPT